MGNTIDLIRKRFGRLVVVKEAGRSKTDGISWECICDCGNIIITTGHNLRRGCTKSCGCLRKEITKIRFTTHNMSRTSTNRTWQHMIQRCTNQKNKSYKDYGGRGITVCDRWLNFQNFLEDMGLKPNGTSIDRINNDLGYFKENCRWATPEMQARNRRINKNNGTNITGVCWNKQCHKYQAAIGVKGKNIYLGLFDTIPEATEARKQGEIKYWGEEYA